LERESQDSAPGEIAVPRASRPVQTIRNGAAALIVAAPIVLAADLPRRLLGIVFYTEQLLAFELAMVLPLLFLSLDWKGRPTSRPRWYDMVLAGAGFAAAGYLAAAYGFLLNEAVFMPPVALAVGAVLTVLSVEGVRRTTGWALALVVLLFLLFTYFGHLLPPPFTGRDISLARMTVYLGIDTNALLGAPLHVAVIVIVPFILLGRLLAAVGGSDFFTALAMAAMGRYRGGAGKIAVAGSSLFGSISGSAVANVAGTGVVTIPLMKKGGFPPHVAGGIEAVASTGGQLMPPVIGASAFLMAEFLGVPYGEVMIAALLPITLYYVAVFIQVDLLAAKLGISGVPRSELPPLGPEFRQGWHFLLPFAVFVIALFHFGAQPELAVLYAIAALLAGTYLFGYHGRRPSAGQLWAAVRSTGQSSLEIVIITAAAGLVIGALNLTGAAFGLSLQLVSLAGDSILILMLLAAAVSIVLGMGMPTVGVYILLATLIAPAMVQVGIAALPAHLFVLYFGMLSMVTPPIAIAAFAAANIAGASPWGTALAAMRLGWTAYIIPFLFVLSPALLLMGEWPVVLYAGITAVLGVGLASAAVVGYAVGRLKMGTRILLGIAGLALLMPSNAFLGADYVVAAGLILGAGLATKLFILDVRQSRAAS
jgi:TRAP transporter 4TM/12TM fusion protein